MQDVSLMAIYTILYRASWSKLFYIIWKKKIISRLKISKSFKIKIFPLPSLAFNKLKVLIEAKIEIFYKNHQSWSNSFENSLVDYHFRWYQKKTLSSKNDADFKMVNSLITIKHPWGIVFIKVDTSIQAVLAERRNWIKKIKF
jgi:hypothetical protein